MITKYMAKNFEWSSGKIEVVQVERETATSVFIDGSRVAKRSSYRCYFDTWDKAHAFLTEQAQANVDSARRRLELANAFAGNVKGMKNPEASA